MCKLKEDGPRCFHHAWQDYEKNAERIGRDLRIINNGQKLSDDEEAERTALAAALKTDPKALAQKEKNRLSILERIRANNSALTPTEQGHYNDNLKRREELESAMNAAAVVDGASKRKELSLIRGDILVEFARSDPSAKKHRDVWVIREFLERRKEDPDTPLTRREIEAADGIYLATPEHFNGRHELTDGNGRRTAMTIDKFRERAELVRRYETLNPALADPEHQNAHVLINNLRKVQKAFKLVVDSVLLKRPLLDEVVAALPRGHATAYRSGKLTPRIITLAVEHDQRMAVYAFYSEKARAYPRLYKNSTDRAAMDAARKLLPATPNDLTAASLAARQRRLDEWGDRIKRGQWVSRQEVEFSTVVAQSPVKTAPPAKPVASASAASASVKAPTRSTGGNGSASAPATSPPVSPSTLPKTPASPIPTVAQPAVATPKSFPPRATTSPATQKSRELLRPLPTTPPQAASPQDRTKPAVKRPPSLPAGVSSGGSLERPTKALSTPAPAEANVTTPRVNERQRSVPQPPVVGGDDLLHRLQRMFKRGS